MTQPDTLHDRLRGEIDRRLAVARAATDAPSKLTGWINWPGGSQRQIGLCFDDQDDPAAIVYLARPLADALLAVLESGNPAADAIRRYEGELEVLERHTPHVGSRVCDRCSSDQHLAVYPCPEILSLASRLGVSVDG